MGLALGSIPAPVAGCPISRSFFARCGIPQALPSNLIRVPPLLRGAPCSHQRTWAENDGRSPSIVFAPDPTRCLFVRTEAQRSGEICPTLCKKRGGWRTVAGAGTPVLKSETWATLSKLGNSETRRNRQHRDRATRMARLLTLSPWV
jgi:hypothetical protein